MRTPLHTLFAAAATSALLACGGGSDPPPPAPPSEAAPPAPAPGPAPSPAPAPAPAPVPPGDHSIAGFDFAQSMVFASGDAELVLTANRAVLVKVNVVAPASPQVLPIGVVQVRDAAGALLRELPLDTPGDGLPSAAPTRPSFADSYSATLPAELVRPGIRLSASFTPAANNTRSVTPRVGGGVALRLVTVPVQIAGTLGQVVADSDAYLRARLPAAQITRVDHAPMVSSRVTTLPTTSDEWSTAFSRILGEVDDLHLVENASARTLYFGFIPKRTSGLAGLGYRPGNAAVAFDLPDRPNAVRETMVHEVGHNLSLRHAPCGGPSNPDPDYPYANAAMGAGNRFIWGYDAAARRFIDPTPSSVHDVMSYCSGNWFSDYNYRLMQVFLTPADRTAGADADRAQALAAAGPRELLVVSGEVDSQGLQLHPLKASVGTPRGPEPGPYRLRIVTAAGTVLEQPFASRELDHQPDRQRFGFSIAHPGAIERVEILRDGRVLQQRAARVRALAAPPSAAPAVQAVEQSGALTVRWDAARHPYLTVAHVAAERTVIALDLQGGAATLPIAALPAGGQFEFGLSDGLNVERVLVNR